MDTVFIISTAASAPVVIIGDFWGIMASSAYPLSIFLSFVHMAQAMSVLTVFLEAMRWCLQLLMTTYRTVLTIQCSILKECALSSHLGLCFNFSLLVRAE